MTKVYFPTNLIYLRKARKLSQRDLGKVLGKSYNAIYKWENGLTEPCLAEVGFLAEFFDVPVDVLLFDDITTSDFVVSR